MSALLEKVKLALRITTDAFNEELQDLIRAAQDDLSVSGVGFPTEDGAPVPLMERAVVLYCKLYFGEPDRAEAWDRLKASYDALKSQLSMAGGYRRES